MYESKNENILSTRHFTLRMLWHFAMAVAIIVVALAMGVLGMMWIESIHWHDAVLNTSLIIAGIGPYILPATTAGKLFFSFYGMMVGLVFVATLGLVLAPLAHRLIHKFHLDDD
ncbi:hypothetical protein CKA81_03290 [Pollutimonas thiosulfatoxidans]|uniref:Two pore domain potassium channel family protein n=2 Tax=Pollutimonas thiosulfatoxidans TaxID=2028345 RepID=A0A451FSJ7_9BURK|nr:two pore domain potassium channel family protein [Alcaligenaceae bacterium]QAA95439.1 hypothetical protein CKA81_03290 [Pollutimonas thiosulfatoxidans]